MLWSVATVKAKIILINLADQKKKKTQLSLSTHAVIRNLTTIE